MPEQHAERRDIVSTYLADPTDEAWDELCSAVIRQRALEAAKHGEALVVRLNDRETYTDLDGCALVAVLPPEMEDPDTSIKYAEDPEFAEARVDLKLRGL